MSSKDRLLVIGLGNTLMGDDGVGIHIINELERRPLSYKVSCKVSGNIDVMDGGTAGIDLLDILSGYRSVIIIDAIRDKGNGLSHIEVLSSDDVILREGEGDYSVHDMELTSVLSLMRTLKVDMPDIKIIGIPAVNVSPKIGLSEECSRFIPEAVELIMDMINPPLPRSQAPAWERTRC